MKHYRTFLTIFVLSFLFIIVTSCSDEPKTSNIELQLSSADSNSTEKSILPHGTTLSVSQYTIECKGPHSDDHISLETGKTKVMLKGLSVGKWNITATGKNKEGLAIIQGEKTITLGESPLVTSITLDQLVGKGDVQINFTWDPEKVDNPSVSLIKKSQNGEKTNLHYSSLDKTTGIASYRATWAAGSYSIIANLIDGEVTVAGGVEAIRVVQSKTSNGTINFNLSDKQETEEDSSLVIDDKSGAPLSYHIEGIPDSIVMGQTATASLKSDLDYELPSDATVEWYVDGILISTGDTCKIEASLGEHRIDALVKVNTLGATTSAKKTFTISLNAPEYTPQVIDTFTASNTNLLMGGHEVITYISNDRFFFYSKKNKTLQLCRIVGDNLSIIKTFRSCSAMPMSDITDMYYVKSTNSLCYTDRATNMIYVYEVIDNDLVFRFKKVLYIRINELLLNCGAGDLAPYFDNGVWVLGYGAKFIESFKTNVQDQNEFDTSASMANHMYSRDKYPDSGLIQGAGDKNGICMISVSDSQVMVNFQGSNDCSADIMCIPVAYPNYSAICALPLTNNTFIVGVNGGIDLLHKNPGYSEKTTILKKYRAGTESMPEMGRIVHFDWGYGPFGNDVGYVYALANDNNCLYSFKVSNIDNDTHDPATLTYIATINLGDFQPEDIAFNADRSQLMLIDKAKKEIKLCTINKREHKSLTP